jgi:hypothetical protein
VVALSLSNFLSELKIDMESPNKELIEKTKKNYPEINSLEPRSQKQIRYRKKGCYNKMRLRTENFGSL